MVAKLCHIIAEPLAWDMNLDSPAPPSWGFAKSCHIIADPLAMDMGLDWPPSWVFEHVCHIITKPSAMDMDVDCPPNVNVWFGVPTRIITRPIDLSMLYVRGAIDLSKLYVCRTQSRSHSVTLIGADPVLQGWRTKYDCIMM